jgi:protein DGCR14
LLLNNLLIDRPRPPKIGDYSLIPKLPSPTPSMLGPAGVEQLTWDPTISQPNTPFHLPNISSRELISHRLSDSASKSLRTKAGLLGIKSLGGRTTPLLHGSRRKGSMAPPTSLPRKADAAGNLTPAAKSLLNRTAFGTAKLKLHSVSGREKEMDLNRVRWTPTPSSAVRRG